VTPGARYHRIRATGAWDAAAARLTYRVVPDKESPMWDTHSQVIYRWTATDSAYLVAYNGQVYPRLKRSRCDYLAFRAVKPAPAD
jgi:hypothetical protein